jgi:3-deoxy-D-manno-octulosonic-acid transferase
MYQLYSLLTFLLTPFFYIWAYIRLARGKEHKKRITERFACINTPRPKGKMIWLHCASVGETMAIMSLVNQLIAEKKFNILITTFTLSGSKVVADRFPKEVIHQFLPFDSPLFAKKFVEHWKPDLVVWTESDFWANIITNASKVSKIVLLNERMSDKSFSRWKKFPGLLVHVLSRFNKILPQSKPDYEKMEFFGAKNLEYIGNLKYSLNAANINKGLVEEVEKNIKGRTIVFIASTHSNEEKIILDQVQRLIKENPNLLIFLAPRHPARTEEVINLLSENNLNFKQRSKTTTIDKETQVYLIDTLGEMNNFFKLSDITIMGGSFVNIGGHNIIEPAKFKNAIICGPFMSNFTQALDEFKSAKAIIQTDAEKLLSELDSLLKNKKLIENYGKSAEKVASSYEKVLPKTLDFILSCLK